MDMDVELRTPSHKIADRVADRLEEDLLVEFPGLVLARIRPHFAQGKFTKRVTPVQSPEGEFSVAHVVSAPWFLIETLLTESREVKKRQFIENRYKDAEKKKGMLVGRWLLKLKPDEVVAEDSDSVALLLLKEAGVEIVQPSSVVSTTI